MFIQLSQTCSVAQEYLGLCLKNFVIGCCLLSSSFLYFLHVVSAALKASIHSFFSENLIFVTSPVPSLRLSRLMRCWCIGKISPLCCLYQKRSRISFESVNENVVSLLLLELCPLFLMKLLSIAAVFYVYRYRTCTYCKIVLLSSTHSTG